MIRDVRFNSRSALHEAASNDLPRAVEMCRLLAQAFPGLVLELDESGLQPLHISCYRGNLIIFFDINQFYPLSSSTRFSDRTYFHANSNT